MKKVFKEAHRITREMVKEYGVDYQAQFGLCLSYLLENEEEEEMAMEKWLENLTEQEKSRLKDIAEMRAGYLESGETAEEYKARQEEEYKKFVKEKYNLYLEEEKRKKKKEKLNQETEKEKEQQYQQDLEKEIATLELYESNKYRCWVAEITGLDKQYGFDRNFTNPAKIEGNYKYYELEEDKIYNYLNHNQQHFVKVQNSKLIEITKEEIKEMF